MSFYYTNIIIIIIAAILLGQFWKISPPDETIAFHGIIRGFGPAEVCPEQFIVVEPNLYN